LFSALSERHGADVKGYELPFLHDDAVVLENLDRHLFQSLLVVKELALIIQEDDMASCLIVAEPPTSTSVLIRRGW
jgi:hypothetical protein